MWQVIEGLRCPVCGVAVAGISEEFTDPPTIDATWHGVPVSYHPGSTVKFFAEPCGHRVNLRWRRTEGGIGEITELV